MVVCPFGLSLPVWQNVSAAENDPDQKPETGNDCQAEDHECSYMDWLDASDDNSPSSLVLSNLTLLHDATS